MLNVIAFLLELVENYVVWLYLACLAVVLFYVRAYAMAHQERANTVFTIEKEVAAHKEGRALSGIGVTLGVVVIITALRYYLVPAFDIQAMVQPTPTLPFVLATQGAEPAGPTTAPEPGLPVPTPTPRPIPTRPVVIPSATPVPPTPLPTAVCPDPNVRISEPLMGAVVAGRVPVRGSAAIDRFQFYKVEFTQGQEPTTWHVINDIHRTAVIGGVLEEFNTTGLPNGVYWLQLTVVDETGNFPPPCQVRVVVQN